MYMAPAGRFICYIWLLARRITAVHTNVTSKFLKTFFLFSWLLPFKWARTVHARLMDVKDRHYFVFIVVWYFLYKIDMQKIYESNQKTFLKCLLVTVKHEAVNAQCNPERWCQSLQIYLRPVLQFCPSWLALLMEDLTGYFHFLYSAAVVGPMQRELEVMQPQMATSANSLRIEGRDGKGSSWRAIWLLCLDKTWCFISAGLTSFSTEVSTYHAMTKDQLQLCTWDMSLLTNSSASIFHFTA